MKTRQFRIPSLVLSVVGALGCVGAPSPTQPSAPASAPVAQHSDHGSVGQDGDIAVSDTSTGIELTFTAPPDQLATLRARVRALADEHNARGSDGAAPAMRCPCATILPAGCCAMKAGHGGHAMMGGGGGSGMGMKGGHQHGMMGMHGHGTAGAGGHQHGMMGMHGHGTAGAGGHQHGMMGMHGHGTAGAGGHQHGMMHGGGSCEMMGRGGMSPVASTAIVRDAQGGVVMSLTPKAPADAAELRRQVRLCVEHWQSGSCPMMRHAAEHAP